MTKKRKVARYSKEELELIVKGLGGLPTEGIKGERHTQFKWMILLEMFQGMRVGEVVQMNPSDVVIQDGIPCIKIDFAGTEERRPLNSCACARTIPIHRILLELNFLEYVKGKEAKLFHLMTYKRYLSKKIVWFNKVAPHDMPVVFRPTFAYNLTMKTEYPDIAGYLMGHSRRGNGKPDIETMSQELNKLDYGFDIFSCLDIKPVSDLDIISQLCAMFPEEPPF